MKMYQMFFLLLMIPFSSEANLSEGFVVNHYCPKELRCKFQTCDAEVYESVGNVAHGTVTCYQILKLGQDKKTYEHNYFELKILGIDKDNKIISGHKIRIKKL